jgi:hypothetical protein
LEGVKFGETNLGGRHGSYFDASLARRSGRDKRSARDDRDQSALG